MAVHATVSETNNACEMQVSGMTCAACAVRLQKVLSRLPGAASADVSFATERARVEFSGAAEPLAVAEAIQRAGFSVPTEVVRLRVSGMTCASCAGRIESAIGRVPGVLTAHVDPVGEMATVAVLKGGDTTSSLIGAIAAAGYGARLAPTDADQEAAARLLDQRQARRFLFTLTLLGACTAPLVLPMVLMPFGVHWMPPALAQWALATVVQTVGGARFYRGAALALRGGAGNMDVLVALGTSAAYGASVWEFLAGGGALYFEASASVILFVWLGKALESAAKRRTGEALAALQALRPAFARLVRQNAEIEVAPEAVGVGELVRVLPGERVPVDGEIVRGESQLDESLLNGESLPVHRRVGDSVVGGSINGEGSLDVRATNVGAKSLLAQVAAQVQRAQAAKAPIQSAVDRVAAVFVPTVIAISCVTGAIWLLWGGVEPTVALMRAVAVLVIACPCALGLATPAALIAGTGAAARAGILVRSLESLERARHVRTVIFDKTGTLTEGRPALLEQWTAPGWSPEYALGLAAAVQRHSEHPLGRALVRAAHETLSSAGELGAVSLQADGVRAVAGRGLTAVVGSQRVFIGSAAWILGSRQVSPRALAPHVMEWHGRGLTAVAVCVAPADCEADTPEGPVVAWFGFADPVRPESKIAVQRLQQRNLRVVMLTGDHRSAAEPVAKALGIERVVAEVLPEQKAAEVERLRADGPVVMVGDGINDAPALATADVGVAMAGGTDVALHTAGLGLLHPDPSRVVDALDIAAATARTIWQNLFWAFAYNAVGIPLAALGYLSPMVAGAAMAASSVSVLANALRLTRWRPAGLADSL